MATSATTRFGPNRKIMIVRSREPKFLYISLKNVRISNVIGNRLDQQKCKRVLTDCHISN